jgi:PAS domain S-box-containing protein
MALGRDAAIRLLEDYHDRLDRARQEGPARFDQAFRDSPAGVGVHEIDRAMRIVRVNPEELRLLGYVEKDVVGRPVWEMIVMQEASQRAIEQKLRGERELKPFVRSFRRADGTAIACILVDRILRDAGGEISGIRTALTEVKAE